MRTWNACLVLAVAIAGTAGAVRAADAAPDPGQHRNAVIDLWTAGRPAFGVFVPRAFRERAGGEPSGPPVPPYTAEVGEQLAANPLYDYVFLNLEGGYDAAHVRAIATGLRSAAATSDKALIVRIPPISQDGAEAARTRIREIFELGGDGVTLPHVRGVEEARQALGFFASSGADIWSPSNPAGEKLAMLMLEDPDAVAEAAVIADLPGLSILACGIGSLRAALGGDAAGAEAGTQRVLAETTRAGLVNMLTANARDVRQRVGEGFLALVMQGAGADDAIRIGRAAAGR